MRSEQDWRIIFVNLKKHIETLLYGVDNFQAVTSTNGCQHFLLPVTTPNQTLLGTKISVMGKRVFRWAKGHVSGSLF